jgi:hypothetical protein
MRPTIALINDNQDQIKATYRLFANCTDPVWDVIRLDGDTPDIVIESVIRRFRNDLDDEAADVALQRPLFIAVFDIDWQVSNEPDGGLRIYDSLKAIFESGDLDGEGGGRPLHTFLEPGQLPWRHAFFQSIIMGEATLKRKLNLRHVDPLMCFNSKESGTKILQRANELWKRHLAENRP